MRIENELKLDFKDVLIKPKRSQVNSRSQVCLTANYRFKNGYDWSGVPIIAANMDGVGTFAMSEALSRHGLMTCLNKSYSVEEWSREQDCWETDNSILSTGITPSDMTRTIEIVNKFGSGIQFICIDVANGYTDAFVSAIKKYRSFFPDKTIIAGNVVCPEMTTEVIRAGADIVKVGIGPGSACTTRIKTGVGVPQLSAIIECSEVAHNLGAHIIADGGCTCPGDVSKALASGADLVMLGGMLAGHDEGGGQIIEEEGRKYVSFYGMSSETAMSKHHGGVASYRTSEGRTVKIPYRGSVEDTINDILGGIRSTCTYVNARTIRELQLNTTFVRVSQQFNSIFVG